jgi:hypothetical protein
VPQLRLVLSRHHQEPAETLQHDHARLGHQAAALSQQPQQGASVNGLRRKFALAGFGPELQPRLFPDAACDDDRVE